VLYDTGLFSSQEDYALLASLLSYIHIGFIHIQIFLEGKDKKSKHKQNFQLPQAFLKATPVKTL